MVLSRSFAGKFLVGGVVLKPSPRDVPDKPLRAGGQVAVRPHARDYSHPAFTLLGNGAYHVAISETGSTAPSERA